MRLFAVATGILLCLAGEAAGAGWSAQERAQLARSGRAHPDVVQALESSDEVRVVVALAKPNARERARRRRERARRADAVLAAVAASDFRPARRFGEVSALAGVVTRRGLLALVARGDVVRVSLDLPVRAQLGESVPMTGLADLHLEGHTAASRTIAVVDTGVNASHEDLVGAVVGEQCFCQGNDGPGGSGCCPNGQDTQSGPGSADDGHAHGTRVSSILTSNGTSSPLGGAPDAELVAVRVLDNLGSGSFSDVIAGLDWILTARPDVDVVNLSLGGGFYPGHCDDDDATTIALAEAIDGLRARGVTSVAGSGNNGNGGGMIAPACIRNAVSVGAVWDEDRGFQIQLGCFDAETEPDLVTCFSNSGPTTDLFAPGALVLSARKNGGANEKAGTSYATPLVAACVAVLMEAVPSATPGQIQAAMELSSTRVTDPKNGLTFPRLECAEALASLPLLVPALPWLGGAVLAASLLAAARVALRR